jgi:thymidylate kinase
MNLIIEGPDCSGKSTLIAAAFADFCVIHNGVYKSPTDAFNRFMQQIPSVHNAVNHPILIWDRNYPSELIYGDIYRQKTLTAEQTEEVETAHLAMGTIVVLCLPPRDVVLAAWRDRKNHGQEYVEMEDSFNLILDAYYENFSDICQLPCIIYDYTTMSVEDLMDSIKEMEMSLNG